MLLRAGAVWLLLVALAIANGAFREAALVPRLGAAAAHVVSTLLLAGLILAVAFVAISWVAPRSFAQAALVGVLWLVLVLAFEFGFGHWVAGKPWRELLADYDLAAGRIWILIPLLTAIAPAVAARWRGLF